MLFELNLQSSVSLTYPIQETLLSYICDFVAFMNPD
jgi:hypothetical protein